MKNQIKAQDIVSLINDNALSVELTKKGKGWEVDGRSFANLSQVLSFVTGLCSIKKNGQAVEKTAKQGEDAIRINPNKVFILSHSFKAPIPSQTKDKKATAEYNSKGGFGAIVKQQLAIVPKTKIDGSLVTDNRGNQVYIMPEELNQVLAIRNNYMKVIDKYCLQYEIDRNRVVSVHHADKVKEAIKEANDALQKVLAEILAKLPDWKEESKRIGHYVDGKFPSASYFRDKYKVVSDFYPLGESFNFEEDVKRNAFGNIRKDLEEFVKSVTAYLSEDSKKFRDSHFKNLSESLAVLKESGVIEGESVNRLIEVAEKAISSVNPAAIREAKQKIDKGVVSASTNKRGRKPEAVTTDDIANCEKYLDTALDPLKELSEALEGLC